MSEPAAIRRIWGARIRNARVAQGLTQVDVAARAGISQNSVSRIERGDGCALDTQLARAAALGVPHADLCRVEAAA